MNEIDETDEIGNYVKRYHEKYPALDNMTEAEYIKHFDLEAFMDTLTYEEKCIFYKDVTGRDINDAMDERINNTMDNYNDGQIDKEKMAEGISYYQARKNK